MKKPVKALLWSALAFPGTGHFFLKRYPRGLLWFVPSLISMGLYLRGLMAQVDFVLDKVESGTLSPDPVAVAALLDNVPQSQVTDIAFWVFTLCWIAAMIDAYMLGVKLEQADASARGKQA